MTKCDGLFLTRNLPLDVAKSKRTLFFYSGCAPLSCLGSGKEGGAPASAAQESEPPTPHLETLALIWAKLPGPLPLSHRPGILISIMFPAYLQTNREKHRLINRWENRDSVAHSSIHSFHPFIHLIYSFISHHNKRIKGKSTGALLLSLPQEESFPNFLVFPTHLLKNIFILTR